MTGSGLSICYGKAPLRRGFSIERVAWLLTVRPQGVMPAHPIRGQGGGVVSKHIMIVMLVVGAVGLSACGESSEDKAAKQVCAATSEISSQIDKLQALPVSSSFPSEVKTSTEAIGTSLGKIRDAAPNLATARKEEVDAATKTVATELALLTARVVSATRSSNLETALKSAEPEVKAALNQLSGAYKSALEALKCS